MTVAAVGGLPRERHSLALSGGVLAVVAWSLGPLCVRGIDASTPTIVLFRLWLAQIPMIAVAYVAGGGLTRSSLRIAVVPGALFAFGLVTSFASYQNTSIANATLIGSLTPAVMLMVAPRIFGDDRSRRQVLMACVSFVGLLFVVLGAGATSGASLRGDFFAVLNLISFVFYFIRMKKNRNAGVDSASLIASTFLLAAIFVTPWALLTSNDLGALGGSDWLLILTMVIVPGLLGHGMMTWAQRYLDITTASLLILGQAPLSTLGAYVFYDERLTLWQVVGALIVLGALTDVVIRARSNAAAPVDTLSLLAE